MNILIVGGAGFLGANLVRRCLCDPGNRVTVLDSLDPHLHAGTEHLRAVWDRIRFVRGSMADERRPRTRCRCNCHCLTRRSTAWGT